MPRGLAGFLMSAQPNNQDPYRALATAVIVQAAKDLGAKGTRGETARGLLFSPRNDYRTLRLHWLALIDLHHAGDLEEILRTRGREGVLRALGRRQIDENS